MCIHTHFPVTWKSFWIPGVTYNSPGDSASWVIFHKVNFLEHFFFYKLYAGYLQISGFVLIYQTSWHLDATIIPEFLGTNVLNVPIMCLAGGPGEWHSRISIHFIAQNLTRRWTLCPFSFFSHLKFQVFWTLVIINAFSNFYLLMGMSSMKKVLVSW